MFEEITLIARDDQVAEKMEEGIRGITALVEVWANDSPAIAKLYEQGVEIKRKGVEVNVRWEGDAADVVAAIDEIRDRIEEAQAARK